MRLNNNILILLLPIATMQSPVLATGSADRTLPGPDSPESFTNHLDSLIGEYQQAWRNSFERAMANDMAVAEGSMQAVGQPEAHGNTPAIQSRRNTPAIQSRRNTPGMQSRLDSLREKFLDLCGPFPGRAPLNARVTGTVKREGYTVEKILFESRPSHYVTALFFLPEGDRHAVPYPGVLIPCGHYDISKGHDEYQSMGALCALNGMAALVFDPLDQGERHQLLDKNGLPRNWGTRSHNMAGIRCRLLGKHLAGYFIQDGMRAIDYMVSREEVDAERIGISGNSGGGTQTAYLFVADERLKVSAPSCFIHNIFVQSLTAMGDAEQLVFGQISSGPDHADYVMMRAPQPLKILAATHDFFRIDAVWETCRYAKRYYTSLGFSERFGILENNAGHNYNREQREAAVQWMLRWLAGRDEVVREPEIELLGPGEYKVTSGGEVLLLPGARSIHDLLRGELDLAAENRKEFLSQHSPAEIAEKIRSLNGMDPAPADLTEISKTQSTREGYIRTEIHLRSGKGYDLKAVLFSPVRREKSGNQTAARAPLLLLSENGTSFHLSGIFKLVAEGRTVMSVELPGTGRLKQDSRDGMQLSVGLNWEDCNKAYLMGRSIVGYRTEDILETASYLARLANPTAQRSSDHGVVDLAAYGETGIPALHAAVLEPERFGSVKISGSIRSWEQVVSESTSFNQLVNTVFDALNYYDLPELAEMLGDGVEITGPITAKGIPVSGKIKHGKLSDKPEYSGLAGVYYGSTGLKNPEGPDWITSLDMSWDKEIEKRGRDWSADWFGYLESPIDGELTILIRTDQSVSLYLDEKLMASVEPGQKTAEVKLITRNGKYHSLRLVFAQNESDKSYLNIGWSWEGREMHDIPPEGIWHSPKLKALMESLWRQAYE